MDEMANITLSSDSQARARWFRRRVLEWSKDHARVFAWRQLHDPYAILIAELMLRRTQARQVEPVFIRFLQAYPNPLALAHAEAVEVAETLAPLGLAWRAGNFIPLARRLEEQHGGHVPCERDVLLTLPGVGPYVADAVRILACDATAALVDTNTVRVAGRFWGFPTHAESRRQRPVQAAIDMLIEPGKARASNLALLDLAALICQPQTPLCSQCPVAARCAFRREHMPPPRRKAPHPVSSEPSARSEAGHGPANSVTQRKADIASNDENSVEHVQGTARGRSSDA